MVGVGKLQPAYLMEAKFMITISSGQLNKTILDALDKLNKTEEESIIINSNGEKFVILKEKDYLSWYETAYLLSSLKNAEILKKALEEPLNECKDLEDVIKELGN